MRMSNYFADMERKLGNILKIKEDYFDESCILIFAYLDGLCQYTFKWSYSLPRKQQEKYYPKEDYLEFIKKYSQKEYILSKMAIDDIYNNRNVNSKAQSLYKKHQEKIDAFVEKSKESETNEIPITEFPDLSDIPNESTVLGKFYRLRCSAVHEYINLVDSDFDGNTPLIIGDNDNDRLQLKIPFEFAYELLMNCFEGAKNEFGATIQNLRIKKNHPLRRTRFKFEKVIRGGIDDSCELYLTIIIR